MHRSARAAHGSIPGPLMPARRPGHRIWARHSRKPPARRAAPSRRVTQASAMSRVERGVRIGNSGRAS
eukprot:1375488-Lingulodinium_polyedra.AAC.1